MAGDSRSSGRNFYPRPPRGGRRKPTGWCCWWTKFLSTPSARRATGVGVSRQHQRTISIHALREEGDAALDHALAGAIQFLSTPSARRATLSTRMVGMTQGQFLSTPSARRATPAIFLGRGGAVISIHALREEDDNQQKNKDSLISIFLSTPSARRATRHASSCFVHEVISIHALREEGDGSLMVTMPFLMRFLSTPSARRATWPL